MIIKNKFFKNKKKIKLRGEWLPLSLALYQADFSGRSPSPAPSGTASSFPVRGSRMPVTNDLQGVPGKSLSWPST